VQYGAHSFVDPQLDCREDPVTVLADGLGGLDHRVDAGPAGLGDPPVDELGDLLGGQVAGEDGAEGFLQRVGAPYLAAAAFELAQGGGLLVGQVGRVLQ